MKDTEDDRGPLAPVPSADIPSTMPLFRRDGRTRSRATLLVTLLLLTVALAGVLTWQAYDAARSHRATAERVLTDYASFASWRLHEAGKMEMGGMMDRALSPLILIDTRSAHALPGPELLVPTGSKVGTKCAHAPGDPTRYYFRANLQTGVVDITGPPPPPGVLASLADTIAAWKMWESWDGLNIVPFFREVEGDSRLLMYGVKSDGAGKRVAAYGFEACLSGFGAPRFKAIMKNWHLLPPALTKKLPNESLLSVVVSDSFGRIVYKSKPQYTSRYEGKIVPSSRVFLSNRVTLRPDAAEKLVIGGLPRSRLPLLLGLLTLTTVLVGAALVQLRREHELARLRSDFVSSVSHELRTPLAQIRMFAETLRLGRVRSEEERRRSLDIIDQEARRLTHLVENVLHFSRSERQQTHISREISALAPEVARVLELFAPIATARGVTVREDLEEGIVAPVDREALRQMLINLLDNAVKYGPQGGIVTVTLTLHGDRVIIRVDDHGPGIAVTERERIWTPFYRLDRDAGSAVAGSGIGLSVVRELVGAHGGRAWAESAPGGGARLVIELPDARRELQQTSHAVSPLDDTHRSLEEPAL